MKVAMLDNLKDSSEQAGGNWYTRFRRFLSDVRSELTRVTWPTRNEVVATTIVVIIVSAIIGLYLYLVDIGLSALMTKVFKVGA
jgi:preprotein translocase subunit SecE